MISGVVAQEQTPLPLGLLLAQRFTDIDVIYSSVFTSGLDQRFFPGAVVDADDLFAPELPTTLAPPYHDDTVVPAYMPRVARDHRLLAPFYTSPDVIHLPDIRIPGYLIPSFLNDIEAIFPTPLILDQGMLRAVEMYSDIEDVYPATIDAAQGIFPQLFSDPELFYSPLAVPNSIGPPFLLSDDVFFNFSSQIIFRPLLFIDQAIPYYPPTSFDDPDAMHVTLSADKLTVTHVNTSGRAGARSTLLRNRGKFYFEVMCGPTHGELDSIGVVHEDGTYYDVSAFSTLNTAVYSSFMATSGATGVIVYGFTRYGQLGALQDGELIAVAVDLDNKRAWFRKRLPNGTIGLWNGNVGADPASVNLGCPVPNGMVSPSITFGGQFGNAGGNPGDNFTANFGARLFVMQPPEGYRKWETESPFGENINGDSFGRTVAGLPTRFDGGTENVTLTADLLTVTLPAIQSLPVGSGARSPALQTYGKYYFEVAVNATHGDRNTIGILLHDSTFNNLMNGGACAVTVPAGTINGTQNSGAIQPWTAGDIISVAVDLTGQTSTTGGKIWFRKNGEDWNGIPEADPAKDKSGFQLPGYHNIRQWSPAVGFGGNGEAVGDSFTANFGQTPFVRNRPNGFGVWSTVFDETAKTLVPNVVIHDDAFPVPFIDNFLKVLLHPEGYFIENEVFFETFSFGGNLVFIPEFFDDADTITPGGYFASFDSFSGGVTITNNGLTATSNVTTQVGARSTAFKRAGKYYFEVTLGPTLTGLNAVGILPEGGTYDHLDSGEGGLCAIKIDANSFVYYYSGGIRGFGNNALTPDVTLQWAVNLDLRKVWLRIGTLLWNNNASANPVTNIGGLDIAPLTAFAPAVTFWSQPGGRYMINFGARDPFVYPKPQGFNLWDGASSTQRMTAAPPIAQDDVIPAPRVSPINLNADTMVNDLLVESIFLLTGTGGDPALGPGMVNDAESVFVPSVAVVVATLTTTSSAAVTLSADNLTATHVTNLNNSGAATGYAKETGKYYFEVTMTLSRGDSDCCGIMAVGATYTNLVTNGTGCAVIYKWSGGIYGNNANSGLALGRIADGDVISMAFDLDAKKCWFRKNGGNWNGQVITSQNPNTGLGGVAIPSFTFFGPAIGFGGTSTAAGDNMRANFGASGFTYPAPLNFEKWPASVAVGAPVTMAGGLAYNVAYSNGNLTVTHSVAAQAGAVCPYTRYNHLTTAKYYFEFTLGPRRGANDCAGVHAGNQPNFNNLLGGGIGTTVVFADGRIMNNGSNTRSLGPCVTGDVFGMAVEFPANRCWIRKNGGLWNNDAAANPATGIGGLSNFANYPFGPAVGFDPTGIVGDSVTFNFGQTAYRDLPPLNFTNWLTLP